MKIRSFPRKWRFFKMKIKTFRVKINSFREKYRVTVDEIASHHQIWWSQEWLVIFCNLQLDSKGFHLDIPQWTMTSPQFQNWKTILTIHWKIEKTYIKKLTINLNLNEIKQLHIKYYKELANNYNMKYLERYIHIYLISMCLPAKMLGGQLKEC